MPSAEIRIGPSIIGWVSENSPTKVFDNNFVAQHEKGLHGRVSLYRKENGDLTPIEGLTDIYPGKHGHGSILLSGDDVPTLISIIHWPVSQ